MRNKMTPLFPVRKCFRFAAALLGAFYLLSVPFVIAQEPSTADDQDKPIAEAQGEPVDVSTNKLADVLEDQPVVVDPDKPVVDAAPEKPAAKSNGLADKKQAFKELLGERIEEAKPETWTIDLELDRIKKNKPNHFHGWPERADYIQTTMDTMYNDSVTRIDQHYGGTLTDQEVLEAERSSMKLGTEITVERDGGLSIGLDYDFDVEIELPRLEKKAKLFVRTGDLDELPSSTISERDNGFQVGLSRESKFKKKSILENSIGVKVKWLPVLFVESKIRRRWAGSDWIIYPQQKFYWESDDGVGEKTTLFMTKWLTDQWVVRSDTGVRWTERSDGVEWDQSIGLLNIFESLVEGDRKSDLFYAYKGAGVEFSMFGHHDGHSVMDRYRISYIYRRPLYQRWIYLNLIPEINWRDDNGWTTDPGIRIGFELVFGDFYSRYR